jgi:hypothetical protein
MAQMVESLPCKCWLKLEYHKNKLNKKIRKVENAIMKSLSAACISVPCHLCCFIELSSFDKYIVIFSTHGYKILA